MVALVLLLADKDDCLYLALNCAIISSFVIFNDDILSFFKALDFSSDEIFFCGFLDMSFNGFTLEMSFLIEIFCCKLSDDVMFSTAVTFSLELLTTKEAVVVLIVLVVLLTLLIV